MFGSDLSEEGTGTCVEITTMLLSSADLALLSVFAAQVAGCKVQLQAEHQF